MNTRIRLGIAILACLVLNGCTAMAVHTGARAVKNIRENEAAGQTAEPNQAGQKRTPRLIHRPGLLHGERQTETTNTSTAGQSE